MLLEEQTDVLRAAVDAVCAELMEIQVAQQIDAERGERPDARRAEPASG